MAPPGECTAKTSEPITQFPSTNSSETYITILIPLISANGEKPKARLPDAAVYLFADKTCLDDADTALPVRYDVGVDTRCTVRIYRNISHA